MSAANHRRARPSRGDGRKSPAPSQADRETSQADRESGRCARAHGALRAGSGGAAPASLDTVGTTGLNYAKRCESRHSNGSAYGHADGPCAGFRPPGRRRRVEPLYTPRGCAAAPLDPTRGECRARRSHQCRTARSWTPRAPEGRGARASWRRYASRVAEELEALGHRRTAERLRMCGTSCEVRTCQGCGDPFATVTVLAGCDVRACVLCARTRAARESVRVAKAADRVRGYVRVRLAKSQADVARALAERASQTRATAARERDCAKLRRWAGELRAAGRGKWAWRMVTLSPQWSPSERASYTPAALAARLDALRAAWSRLWRDHLGCGGYAAAYVSVEISDGGHVHLHALHYGAWASQATLARDAGMMVDVREASGDAVREVVKYCLKGPSPRDAWMGGEAARVPHPRLAAAWVVATRGRRLVEPYGVLRDALHAVDACEPDEEPEPPRCASCGCADLADPVRLWTADVARESRAMEARDPRGRPRWTLRAEVDARGGLSTTGPVCRRARVQFV